MSEAQAVLLAGQARFCRFTGSEDALIVVNTDAWTPKVVSVARPVDLRADCLAGDEAACREMGREACALDFPTPICRDEACQSRTMTACMNSQWPRCERRRRCWSEEIAEGMRQKNACMLNSGLQNCASLEQSLRTYIVGDRCICDALPANSMMDSMLCIQRLNPGGGAIPR